jgi:ATP-binding cassette, subfamily B, bacterial MsbA
MKILRRLIPFARPFHHFFPEYIVYTFLSIIFGLINFALLIPVLNLLFKNDAIAITAKPAFSLSIGFFKDFFNYHFTSIVNEHNKFYALVFVCCIIGISILLANIFRYMAVRVILRLRLKLMAGIRNVLYDKYVKQSLSYHHNKNKSELLMAMTNEVQEIESSVINSLQIMMRDPFIVIAYFCVLLYWSVPLTLFTLLFLPLTGIAISLLTKKLRKLSYFSSDMMNRLLGITEESVSGIRPLQSFTAEDAMSAKFREVNNNFTRHSKRLFGKKELASPISETIGVIAALCLVVFGGYLILYTKTALSGEAFIAYLALYTQMIQPLKNISSTSSNLQRGIVACEKIFDIVDSEIVITDKPTAISKNDFNTAISINDISFTYGNNDVINTINLTIAKGKTVALVGQSGSGKSTLVDLICRFYDVQKGSITIDGANIADIKMKDLRGLISVVSQDNFLFNDTIASNIALSNPAATADEIVAAAKIANAHEFITAMPEGYNTITGERGVKLSGGQRQRITIARAILKNSPIIILDEATSALDTESERLVQDAINNLMSNRTSIVIAHRLSTVRHADEIIVMQQGQIVERGTHDGLIVQNGFYKKLVDMQEVK